MARKRLVSPGSVNTSIQCCLIELRNLLFVKLKAKQIPLNLYFIDAFDG